MMSACMPTVAPSIRIRLLKLTTMARTHTHTCLVLLAHSLFNPDAIEALLDDGFFYAVGDNSLPELQAPNGYSMFNTVSQ